MYIVNDPFREETLNLPASAVRILERTLEEMARGNAVTPVPVDADLTTHEATNMLSISSRSLTQLLEGQDGVSTHWLGPPRPVGSLESNTNAELTRSAEKEQLAASDQKLGI